MSRRAHTLLEVVVVAGLGATLMTIVIVSFLMLNQSSRMQKARIDARQQLRASMAKVRAELQSAGYVYAGYTGQFAGNAYTVPAVGTTVGTGDLLFAVPESTSLNNILWKICGLRVVPRDPVDPNNPTALDILEESVEDVGPAPLDDPAQLSPQLPNLTPVTRARFDAYVEPGSWGLLISPAPTNVLLQFTFKIRPNDVAMSSTNYFQTESYQTEVFLRNQPPLAPSP